MSNSRTSELDKQAADEPRRMLRLIGAVLVGAGDAAQMLTCEQVDDIAYALAVCGEVENAMVVLTDHAEGNGPLDGRHGGWVHPASGRLVEHGWTLAQGYVRDLAAGRLGVPGVTADGDTYRICGKSFTDDDGEVLQCTNLDGVGHEGACDQ